MSFFYQPKRFYEFGRLAAGAIIGGISVGASFALAGLIASQIGLDFNDIDVALGIGYVIGLLSVGVIAWIANFLQKREDKDILQVMKEITKNPPVKRAPRKAPSKTPAKTGSKPALGRTK